MKTVYGLESAREALLAARGLDLDADRLKIVQCIVDRVRGSGDRALRELTQELDGFKLESIEVPESLITKSSTMVGKDVLEALTLAADRIQRFHEASMPHDWMDADEGYGERFNPVDRVGVYVPGGTARFPSTMLMTAIPARVAGVAEVFACTPSVDGGTPHPMVLAAAAIAGVDRVFQIGGAQAIAAMAYGTDTVPPVDLVCGPGNIYTTLAKKLVYGRVGIDGLFGPTETVVIADETANPTLCAADLVAQAEHDPLATSVLITTSVDVAKSVEKEAELRASRLARSEVALASLERHGGIVITDDIGQAIELANEFAPEHLSLMVREPAEYVDRVRNAGALFLGEFSHEVLGDYVAGPSHVMPTGGTARFSSGLGVRSFLKVSPVISLDRETASRLSKTASVLARAEGFTGHAEAAEIRDELPGT